MRLAVLLWLAAISLPAASEETPLERSNRILKQIGEQFQRMEQPNPARIETLPQPATTPSPSEIAGRFSQQPQLPTTLKPEELLVFASFSMPPASLQRIVEESEASGAKIVFRGFRGNTMRGMSQAVSGLLKNHKVEVLIDPDAFRKFGVDKVPVTLIARASNQGAAPAGCNSPDDYVKVAGDVSQGYALDLIERKSPEFANAARRFGSRMARK